MFPSRVPPLTLNRRCRGVALVIVLAFVVLLTGLIVAFFSRALSERQISNSSASQTRVDQLAQSAVSTIVGDLKQEIVAGSTQPIPGVYTPTPATAIIPALVGTNDALPNLLKRSLRQAAFFPYTSNGNPAPTRASDASSATSSQNGRTISPARWNKPLLLPKANPGSDTDLTPGNFTAPDWIVVARDGTNPPAWNANLGAGGDKQAIGRYAYNIYNAGGLLDVNVAGYPDVADAPAPQNTVPAYKKSATFADLTQLPGISGLDPKRQKEIIGTLAGWRNYASSGIDLTQASITAGTPVGGSLNSGYTWSNPNLKNFLIFSQFNSNGFLSTANSVIVNNQSDRIFGSRQQLISLLLNGVAKQDASGTAERAALQNALQCLGTFSRDLNQPSYTGYDSAAPPIQPAASGGNNQAALGAYVNPSFPAVRVTNTFKRNDGSDAVVGEPLVKQRFALSRLAWLTYQGPSADRAQTDADMQLLISTHGIPYSFLTQGTAENIKKYFGLSWVVDSGSKLGKWLYNVHNGPAGKGDKGTILTLVDVPAPSNTKGLVSLTPPREPDFFELLKATISAGSKAKSATIPPTGASANPTEDQAKRDVVYNYAVMQLGANIIAQSKVDGYGVRIGFDDGTGYKEFYGVENNPYFYRARMGVLKIRNEEPVITGKYPVSNAPAVPAPGSVAADVPVPPATEPKWGDSQGILKDPGVSMLMLIPEIWNPHDQNADSAMPTGLKPVNFRIVADSADPDTVLNGTGVYVQTGAAGRDTRSNGNPHSNTTPNNGSVAEPTGSFGQPPFSRAKGGRGAEIKGSYGGYLHTLKAANAAMTFTIPSTPPNSPMFREPTLLARADVPRDSKLKIDTSGWNANDYPETADYSDLETSSGTKSFVATGGFMADATNPLVLPDASLVTPATQYVGIPIGLFPSQWVRQRTAFEPQSTRMISRGDLAVRKGSENVTFRMQYEDPTKAGNWITYDVKYMAPSSIWLHNILAPAGAGGMMQWSVAWASFTDPRTSRFGGLAPNGKRDTAGNDISSDAFASLCAPGAAKRPTISPSGKAYGAAETAPDNVSEWLDPAKNVLISNRPHADAGQYFSINVPGIKALPTQTGGWYSDAMYIGMLSQNSVTLQGNGMRYSGDNHSGTNGKPGTHYYADADTVVRRAAGAYNTSTSGTGAMTGLPMASVTSANPSQSRPWILHRPFRSVAELGYVFSDTPWKNIDFFAPESGDAGLLDVFCINEISDPSGLTAGKVSLNTRNASVLTAILANGYRDEKTPGTVNISPADAKAIADAIVKRTGANPLLNPAQLVGRWKTGSSTAAPVDGSTAYDGVSNDPEVIKALGTDSTMTNIQRFREGVVRPLAAVGSTRTWNLMIDVVAQTGRYPQSAGSLDKFVVEGEQRCWVHVAIDRFTGRVLDKQIEVVKE